MQHITASRKIFNTEVKSFDDWAKSTKPKSTIVSDATAKRQADDMSAALSSAMKAGEFKKNTQKYGSSGGGGSSSTP